MLKKTVEAVHDQVAAVKAAIDAKIEPIRKTVAALRMAITALLVMQIVTLALLGILLLRS
jgi:hypothetical protein